MATRHYKSVASHEAATGMVGILERLSKTLEFELVPLPEKGKDAEMTALLRMQAILANLERVETIVDAIMAAPAWEPNIKNGVVIDGVCYDNDAALDHLITLDPVPSDEQLSAIAAGLTALEELAPPDEDDAEDDPGDEDSDAEPDEDAEPPVQFGTAVTDAAGIGAVERTVKRAAKKPRKAKKMTKAAQE